MLCDSNQIKHNLNISLKIEQLINVKNLFVKLYQSIFYLDKLNIIRINQLDSIKN